MFLLFEPPPPVVFGHSQRPQDSNMVRKGEDRSDLRRGPAHPAVASYLVPGTLHAVWKPRSREADSRELSQVVAL